jgi:hypothetical protein
MKKRKLNSKNPKYKTLAEIKANQKHILKQELISEAKNCKIYATFYK